jgi:Tfp pilus assembly protein PilX
VLSVIDNVRRSANLMGKEIADNISESGLLDRDSSIDVHQEMLEMSMRKFN